MKRQQVKAIIELSSTFEEADDVIANYAGLKTTKEKIAFIKGMFDVEIFDYPKDASDDIIYRIMLTAIIEKKWI